MADIYRIIQFLDDFIERERIPHLSPVEANKQLEQDGLLKDSYSRPGLPLRRLLRDGKIPHAYQPGGKNSPWIIPHSSAAKTKPDTTHLSEKFISKPEDKKVKKRSVNQEENQYRIGGTVVEFSAGMPVGPDERYEIVRICGRGGMGVVYEAVDHGLDRPRKVALKQLNKVFAQDRRSVKMVTQEVGIARELRHPNICGVYDYINWRDEHIIIMEWIGGSTLSDELFDQPDNRYSPDNALKLLKPIAAALDYAHKRKPPVVHRDLKPLNVMLTAKGEVKVTDFGLSREVKESVTRVTGKDSSGSLEYMPFEQYMGDPPAPVHDIYGLGITAYELLNGQPPFTRGDLGLQHKEKTPATIADIPQELMDVLLKCLAKDEKERYTSTGEFIEAFEESLKGELSIVVESRRKAEAQRVAEEKRLAEEKRKAAADLSVVTERRRKAAEKQKKDGDREKTLEKKSEPGKSKKTIWGIASVVMLIIASFWMQNVYKEVKFRMEGKYKRVTKENRLNLKRNINFMDLNNPLYPMDLKYNRLNREQGVITIEHKTLHYEFTINGNIDIFNFFIIEEIGTIDIDKDGNEEIFITGISSGSGTGMTINAILIFYPEIRKKIVISITFSKSPGYPLPNLSYSKNFKFNKFKEGALFLDELKYLYGYKEREEIESDLGNPNLAEFHWRNYNNKISNGKMTIIKYNGKQKNSSSETAILHSRNITYKSYFKGSVIAYDNEFQKHYILFIPKDMYSWPTILKKTGPYLIIGTRGEGVAIVNVENFYLKRYDLSSKNNEVEKIGIINSEIIVNGDEIIMLPSF